MSGTQTGGLRLLPADLQVVLVFSWSFVDEALHRGLCAQVQPNYGKTGVLSIRKMERTTKCVSCVSPETRTSEQPLLGGPHSSQHLVPYWVYVKYLSKAATLGVL